eukprot:TRINITY_DN73119_c0_g1_i1.p1 TRINITY_DN73119_c0_g1~~TRINITY_DN73119_c0_g1_i1.p1  ORF type:complete len:108 (-),score=9.51 TRINITY_DN73119_c0_g1_i1:180-503(-)
MLNTDFLKLRTFPIYQDKLKIEIPQIKYDKKIKSTERPPLQRAPNIEHFNLFHTAPDKNILLYKMLQPRPQADKWTAWNTQLKASIDYWHKRFPYTETPRRQARVRV